LKQIFKKSWEYGKDLFACFVDLLKTYDGFLEIKGVARRDPKLPNQNLFQIFGLSFS